MERPTDCSSEQIDPIRATVLAGGLEVVDVGKLVPARTPEVGLDAVDREAFDWLWGPSRPPSLITNHLARRELELRADRRREIGIDVALENQGDLTEQRFRLAEIRLAPVLASRSTRSSSPWGCSRIVSTALVAPRTDEVASVVTSSSSRPGVESISVR